MQEAVAFYYTVLVRLVSKYVAVYSVKKKNIGLFFGSNILSGMFVSLCRFSSSKHLNVVIIFFIPPLAVLRFKAVLA